MKLIVVSFSNIIDEGYKNYEMSLKKFGYEYTILGKNIKWEGFVKTKIRNIYKYLKSLPQKNTIVCITDVNDVIACCKPEEVIEKFLSYNSSIILGVEETHFFFNCVQEQRKKYPANISRVYANGGFYMGYISDIIKMYDYMFTLDENDDQLCLGNYNVTHDEHVLDTKSKLVYNIFNNTYEIRKGRVYAPYSKEYPCFVHMMGKFTCNHICKNVLGNRYHHISLYDATMHNLGKLKIYFNQLKNYILIGISILACVIYLLFGAIPASTFIFVFIIIILYLVFMT